LGSGLEDPNQGDNRDALIKHGQSSNISHNLGAKSQFLLDKSDGQSLEDTIAGRTNVNFGPFSLGGIPALVSPTDDDPLVWQACPG
jgi:hypothetical protein